MGNVSSAELALDLPVIIVIAVVCWTAVILLIVGIRQLLLSRGVCEAGCGCAICGSEDSPPCCDCCIAMSESCNCCNPSVGGCLNKCCPNRKSLSCVEILLCQCFGTTNCLTNNLTEIETEPASCRMCTELCCSGDDSKDPCCTRSSLCIYEPSSEDDDTCCANKPECCKNWGYDRDIALFRCCFCYCQTDTALAKEHYELQRRSTLTRSRATTV